MVSKETLIGILISIIVVTGGTYLRQYLGNIIAEETQQLEQNQSVILDHLTALLEKS